ncbi:MAG: esterase/lipase family protein [Egibacteraceae bacterium]
MVGRDVVVVVPGILGSTLRKDGQLVWAPSAGAVTRAIRTLGRSVRGLELPEGIGDGEPEDGVQPVDVVQGLHLLPGIWSASIGYRVLLRHLEHTCGLIPEQPHEPGLLANLITFPYDWRLSNRVNGRRLKARVTPVLERWRGQGGRFADAELVLVCHSMGGLVARWYLEKEQGAEVTRKLVTIGTPHRGAVKALAQLVNGVHTGIGPLKADLTGLALSMPSMYELLPEYACIDSAGKLLKTTETSVPELPTKMVEDGARFHDQLNAAGSGGGGGGYDLIPIVGTRQRTWTTARISGQRMETLFTVGGEDERGDATVPRLSATPRRLAPDSDTVRWVADQHGSLPHNQSVLDELERVLTAGPVIRRAAYDIEVEAHVEELILAGGDLEVRASVAGDTRVALRADVTGETGEPVRVVRLRAAGRVHRGVVEALAPGAYQVTVGGVGAMATRVSPVTCATLVWDPTEDT